MAHPESYYLGALKSALEGDIDKAERLFERGEEAKSSYGFSFSESVTDEFPFIEEAVSALINSYDFTRCMRPNGTFYGTRGKCKQGTEAAPADSRGTGQKGSDEAAAAARARGERGSQITRARVAGKKAAIESSRKEGGEKQRRNNERLRVMKELMADPRRKNKLQKLVASGADDSSLEKFWGDLAIEVEGRIARKSR